MSVPWPLSRSMSRWLGYAGHPELMGLTARFRDLLERLVLPAQRELWELQAQPVLGDL